MATSLPALDATMHVSSVTYACTFAPTTAQEGAVVFSVPQPVQFTFTFDTGQFQPDPGTDLYDITTDSSWFDQDEIEASIAAALGTICGAIAPLLGVTQADIEATVTIARSWRVTPDQAGSAAPVQVPAAPLVYAEVMTYP